MGSYSRELATWFLLVIAGTTFTASSQAHGIETNDKCLTEERIDAKFSDLKDTMKEELTRMAEHQAHLEKVILTMADSLAKLTTRTSALCTESQITTGSPTSEKPDISVEEFYAAARGGDIDYITSQLEQDNSGSSSNRINNLLTWHNENYHNRTALHIAAERGHEHVVLALLEAGASTHAEDRWGTTPLHLAADRGHYQVVLALLEAGASTHAEDYEGQTPLHLATDNSHTRSLSALLNHKYHKIPGLIHKEDNRGRTAAFVAAANGHSSALDVLEANGANVHTVDNAGWSPLMWASRFGEIAPVQDLINSGATVGHADHEGYTALHEAAAHNNTDIVRLLLQNGADKSHQNRDYRTAADSARLAGHNELADLIDNWQ